MSTFKVCETSFDWTSKGHVKVVSYGMAVDLYMYSRHIRHEGSITDLISMRLGDQMIPSQHKYRPRIEAY